MASDPAVIADVGAPSEAEPERPSRAGARAVRMNMKAGGAERVLRNRDLASWSLVALVANMMMTPLNAVIPAFYAKNTATSLAAIGGILLVARLYDAVVDPTIGYLSDHTRSPLGRRKPWILAGGALTCIAVPMLFNPNAGTNAWYFLGAILLFYTAYSMMAVPHGAWGSELSRTHHERSLLSGVLPFAGIIGLLLFMGFPIVVSSPLLPIFKTAEVTPPMLKAIGILLVALVPICVLIPVLTTPRGAVAGASKPSALALLKSVRFNHPLRMFLLIYTLTGLGYGVYYGTHYLFIDSYLGMADKFPLVYTTVALAQIVAIPLWTLVSGRFERSRMWAVGIAAFGLLLPLQLLLPHGDAAFPMLAGLVTVTSFANAASQVPQMAVISDCIDYGVLKTGVNFAGSYNALQQFTLKASLAVGGGLSFLILSWAHFDAKTVHHSVGSMNALSIVATVLPLCLFGGAGALLWNFPLNRERQLIVRRRIEGRLRAG